MSKKVNWGIIGLGKIANKFAEDLMLVDDAEIYAVASRDINKSRSFGQLYHATKCYGSYEDLANDPDIDVVYIATPHVLHFENAMMCMRAKKSVLCEKPMGMNQAEVNTLVKESRTQNVFLMEALWSRFIPAMVRLHELIDANAIGRILNVRADFGFKAAVDLSHRLINPKLGGGALLDIGIYPVYLALVVLGEPTNIKAIARITATNIDSSVAILFDYGSNGNAILDATIEANTATEATIYGELGSIKVHSRFHHPTKLTISSLESTEVVDIPYQGNGYYHEIIEVMNCLNANKTESDRMPLSLSQSLIKTLDQVRNEIGLTYDADRNHQST